MNMHVIMGILHFLAHVKICLTLCSRAKNNKTALFCRNRVNRDRDGSSVEKLLIPNSERNVFSDSHPSFW